MLTIVDLPRDIIRMIFGHDNHIVAYPWLMSNNPSDDTIQQAMIGITGRHTCKYLRDILAGVDNWEGDYEIQPLERVAEIAAYSGHLSLVRWAVDTGYYPMSGHELCRIALARDNASILGWAVSRGYDPPDNSLEIAARNGNLEMFEFLMDQSFSMTDDVVNSALQGGNIDILNRLKTLASELFPTNCHDLPFDDIHLKSLQWIYDQLSDVHHIGWHAMCFDRADIIEWMHEVKRDVFDANIHIYPAVTISTIKSIKLIEWFIDHGYVSKDDILAATNRADVHEHFRGDID